MEFWGAKKMMTFLIVFSFIIVGIIIMVPVFQRMDQKEKGFLCKVSGKVHELNYNRVSTIYLYPFRITINDKYIIPLNKVKKCKVSKFNNSTSYRGTLVKRIYPILEFELKNADGTNDGKITCDGRKNSLIDYKDSTDKWLDQYLDDNES